MFVNIQHAPERWMAVDSMQLRINDRTLSTDEAKVLRQTFELYEQTEQWSTTSKRSLDE